MHAARINASAESGTVSGEQPFEYFAVNWIFEVQKLVQDYLCTDFLGLVEEGFVEGEPAFARAACPFVFHRLDMNFFWGNLDNFGEREYFFLKCFRGHWVGFYSHCAACPVFNTFMIFCAMAGTLLRSTVSACIIAL